MSKEESANQNASGGISSQGDMTLQADGDIVAGNKTTIKNYYGPKPRDITKAPYKFLAHYGIADRDIFFGRDKVSEELAGLIPRHKVLIIRGQSGSGKTSLINAGLIPRLAEDGYLYLSFREYADPLKQLRAYLDTKDSQERFPITNVDEKSLLQIARSFRDIQQQSRVVVIFDQFERFFVGIESEPKRQEFLSELKQCLTSELTADDMNLVFSLRREFYGQFMDEAEAIIPSFRKTVTHTFYDLLIARRLPTQYWAH